jgi:NCS1 family nucleobase:cation symporter-1
MSQSKGTSTIEVHHVDVISRADRHGTARDLFPVWFASNLNVGNAFFGALAVIVGNSFFWAVVVVILGNIAGAAFMSLHSIQGAKLGVPQLIQSRGQFGFIGALLPIALAACLYLGFFSTTAVIGGQFLSAAMPAIDMVWAPILVSAVSLLLALLGYRAIHTAAKWGQWPLAVAVIVVTIASLAHGGFDLSMSGFAVGPFLTAFGIIATFLLTYAPYVSDYSRYLPYETKASDAFWWTFGGSFLGTLWTELLGVMLAVQFTPGDTAGAIKEMFGEGWVVIALMLVTTIAIAGNNAMNLYGGMLNLITAISTFKAPKASVALRVGMLIPTFALGLAIAVAATADFNALVSTFLSFLLLGFVPWGIINLVDYYWIRKGDYDVDAFFKPKGRYFANKESWTYAGLNLKALLAYAIGIAVSLPFVNNAAYQGSATALVDGADISWIPGLIVTGAVYLLFTANNRVKS